MKTADVLGKIADFIEVATEAMIHGRGNSNVGWPASSEPMEHNQAKAVAADDLKCSLDGARSQLLWLVPLLVALDLAVVVLAVMWAQLLLVLIAVGLIWFIITLLHSTKRYRVDDLLSDLDRKDERLFHAHIVTEQDSSFFTTSRLLRVMNERLLIGGVGHALSLTRFPGHPHSGGEEPPHEVQWENNVGHSVTSTSETRFGA